MNVGKSLLFSPLIGFVAAALLLLVLKFARPQSGTLLRTEGRHASAAVDPRRSWC